MSCIYCLDDNGAIYKNNFCPCVYYFHKECTLLCMVSKKDLICPICRKQIDFNSVMRVPCICSCNYVFGEPYNDVAIDEYSLIRNYCCLKSIKVQRILLTIIWLIISIILIMITILLSYDYI